MIEATCSITPDRHHQDWLHTIIRRRVSNDCAGTQLLLHCDLHRADAQTRDHAAKTARAC